MKRFVLLTALLLSSPAIAGVTIGTYGATDATGWTTFTATAITSGTCAGHDANGTCMWYLSNSTGVDSGNCTSTAPCKTINFVYNNHIKFRNGSSDWMLFKKGDSWTGEAIADDGATCCWPIFGASSTAPFVIAAYDPLNPTVVNPPTGGARPIIKPGVGGGAMGCQGQSSTPPATFTHGCNNIAIVGIEFYAYQSDPNIAGVYVSPNTNGIGLGNPISWFLLEDCKFSFGQYAIITSNPLSINTVNENIRIRRNIIMNSWGNGVEVAICQTCSIYIIEENVFYHNSWISVTAPVTLTAASPTVVTWANNMSLTDRAQGVTFSPGCTGLVAGTVYYPYNNNHSTFNLSSSAGSNVAVNLSSCAVTSQMITWIVQVGGGFNHQLYSGGNEFAGDPNGFQGPLTLRGNIFASSSDPACNQIRGLSTLLDNLFIKNNCGHNFGSGQSGTYDIINNVYLSGEDLGEGFSGGFNSMKISYKDIPYNVATFNITGNLIVNATSSGGNAISITDGYSITYTNNIVYNFGSSPAIAGNTGSVVSGTITNAGSGYTDNSIAITGISTDADTGYAVLTVGSTAAAATNGRAYVTGLGGGGCTINNHGFNSNKLSGTTILLQGATVGTCTAAGNVYLPIGSYGIHSFGTSSGSGTGFAPQLISVGAQIKEVWYGGSESTTSQIHAGSGYVVNESLSNSSAPGGSGFTYRVDTVSAFTNGGGNQLFPTGPAQSGWPIPTATAASYYDLIAHTTGSTTDSYINATLAQNKVTWNPLLMPNTGINQYMRAAFGVGKAFVITNP